MAAPTSINELLELAQRSGIVDESRLNSYVTQLQTQQQMPQEANKLAGLMVRDGLLTFFQAEQLLMGKWRRFQIGKYKVLERLGSGGMGQVFLCEHKMMKRRVAVKVLPTAKADDPSSLERFYREARVVGALDHVNIVRAYDIDQDDNLHFLVMEYVDGTNLQDLIKKFGPMDPLRACHYMYQSANGLQHAFDEAGIIHRDIKPGNILVDRQGTVKILDMGLARFFHDDEDLLTKQYDETVLGTADYLAPEQAIDSHSVDIRADIYSLGATFYFLLTGSPPFADGTVAQKLIWHQTKQPKPIQTLRPQVPREIVAIVERMMAKDVSGRYQMPRDVAAALAPIVATPIPPPPDVEMPHLSPAAMGLMPTGPSTGQAPRLVHAPSAPTTSNITEVKMPAAPMPAAPMPVVAPRPAPASPTFNGGRGPTARPPAPPPIGPRVQAEETPIWAAIAAETETPKPKAAKLDTQKTRPAYKPPSTTISGGRTTPVTAKSKTAKWVVLIVAGMLIGVLAVGLIIALGLFGGNKQAPGPGTTAPTGPQQLIVDTSKAPEANSFKQVAQALMRARPGDRILVRGPGVEEEWQNVEANHFPKGVTVEADISPGQYMTWQLPPSARDLKAVFNAANVDGLKFKGFAFDGQNRAENGIYMHSRCPGVVFEDCRIQNCKETGIKLSNATGDSGRPITFRRMWLSGTPTTKAVVYLFASSSLASVKANQHVSFEKCIVEGPGTALTLVEGSADSVSFAQTRFCRSAEGFLLRPTKDTRWSHIALNSNTFHKLTGNAIRIEGLPDNDAPGVPSLVLNSNLFTSCKAVFAQVGDRPLPGLAAQGNYRDDASAPGNLLFEVPSVGAVQYLTEDAREARDFLRPATAIARSPAPGAIP